MRRSSRALADLAGSLGLALVVAGCATTASRVVEDTRLEVEGIENAEKIRAHAGVQVYEAKRALARLERAARNGADSAELEHLAFLTRRRVEVARIAADGAMLREALEMLGEQRDQLRLQARAEEAASARARARSAEERLRALQAELREVEAATTERGLVLTLGDILFAFDRAELQPGAQRTLDRIAEFLNEHSDRRVEVEGHTDSVGDARYNQDLSRRRAEAVARHLVSRGVAASRVEARGLGEAAPVASNDTEAGRQQNRRVEIVVPN